MKVEIGGGKAPRHPEYEQLDIVKHPQTKYVAPAWKLPFKDNTVEKIYSRHLLEHLDRTHADMALKEWHRTLKRGGEVEAILPDLVYHARQLLQPDLPSDRVEGKTNLEHALAGFYGWSDGPMHHLYGYTSDSLLALFNKHSFQGRLICPEFNGDLHVIARKV